MSTHMSTHTLRLIMAQLNFLVGDIIGNAQKIIHAIQQAKDQYHAHLLIFPELALTGYPPEDLLYRHDLYQRIDKGLERIQAATTGIDVILGYPRRILSNCYNHAVLIRDQKIIAEYDKQCLPNYSVFDEKRYFAAGSTPTIVDIQDIPVAITICEDLWCPEPIVQAKSAEAKLIISINASPFTQN